MFFTRTSLSKAIVLLFILTISIGALSATVPSTLFGMHLNRTTTPWPTIGFGTLRLWDSGVAWASINTAKGTYSWSKMDYWISTAQQHNTDLVYTFGRTPQWASSNASLSSCNYGPGQCVAPADYANWDEFVSQIATRYKGKIKYYELWNEPNDTGFWQGTTAQLIEMSRRASNIIRSIDPNAEILSPAPTWTSTTAWAWLDGYFAGGGANYIDIVSYHGYTGNNKAESILGIIDNVQKTMTARGVSKPMIISEGGWGLNTVISNADAQAAFLAQRYMLIQSRPAVQRFYWYMYDNSTWGTLWDATNGVNKSGVAYGEIYKWLVGADGAGCTQAANYTWTCSFTRANGYQALAMWNPSTTTSYTPSSTYIKYRTLDGATVTIAAGGSVSIGNKPILLESATGVTQPTLQPLSATLSVTPLSGTAPLTANATVASTTDPTATIQSVSISFGNGTVANANTGSTTYTAAGNYTVTATVQDSLGRTATKTATVAVAANAAPTAALSISPATGNTPLATTASTAGSSDPDGSIASTTIDFGDGTVVNGASASHTYTTAGSFTVKATVVDNLGLSSTATTTVSAAAPVNVPPVAVISVTPNNVIAPTLVTATTAASTDADGTIVYRSINWGDGSALTFATSGTHTYTKAGTYTVTATIKDNVGAVTRSTATVTVNWGVKITAPGNNATVTSPVRVTAQASSNVSIKSMRIYVGSTSVYTVNAASLNTLVNIAKGTKTLTVQATDVNGVTRKSVVTVYVQ